MNRVVVRHCSRLCCLKKPTSKCICCQKPHCKHHHAKNTDWGQFVVKEDPDFWEEFDIPFKEWMFLVCWRCASKTQEFKSWLELVERYPYTLKYITEKSQREKAWKAFKSWRERDPKIKGYRNDFLKKKEDAKLYFGVESDHYELEESGFEFPEPPSTPWEQRRKL